MNETFRDQVIPHCAETLSASLINVALKGSFNVALKRQETANMNLIGNTIWLHMESLESVQVIKQPVGVGSHLQKTISNKEIRLVHTL